MTFSADSDYSSNVTNIGSAIFRFSALCEDPMHVQAIFFSFSCFKFKCFNTTKIMYLYVSLWVIIVSSKTVPILKKGTNFRFIPFHTILNSCFQLLPILNAKKTANF